MINIENLKEPLDNETEIELFKEYNLTKNLEIRNKIVEHNLKLVVYRVLKKFNKNSVDKDDLFMSGTIGLIKAVDNYSLSSNTKFSTYATKSIDNEISYHIYCYYKSYCSKSLNEKISPDSDEELQSLLKDKTNEEENSINKLIIESKLRFLSEREKDVLLSFYGALGYNKLTQEELSKKYNITKGAIWQIINESLVKMNKKTVKRPISIYNIFRTYDRKQINKALSLMSKEDLKRLEDISLLELHSEGKEKELYKKLKKYL